MQISHKSIYKYIYTMPKGNLKKQLKYLRKKEGKIKTVINKTFEKNPFAVKLI